MSLIKAENLILGYETGIVISDLNFQVNEGDYLCIVGENGSGKTTLMKTLLGLKKPFGGKLYMDSTLKNTGIGYLPQQNIVQKDFPASVKEIVLSGCQARGDFKFFYSKDDIKKAESNMRRMDIFEMKDMCFRELSGGQRQRVLLSRALCAADKILLLDEPISGLDPKVTLEMYELIDKLNKEGITIIMISHDIHMAIKYADHILHIGEEYFYGTTDEYLESDIGKYISRGGNNG